jgi:hypothetical protein
MPRRASFSARALTVLLGDGATAVSVGMSMERGFDLMADGEGADAQPTSCVVVSPSSVALSRTIFRERGFRFYFFSREETRMHVHVACGSGKAKFWLEPEIGLAQNFKLDRQQLKTAERLIRFHEQEIRQAWHEHLGR